MIGSWLFKGIRIVCIIVSFGFMRGQEREIIELDFYLHKKENMPSTFTISPGQPISSISFTFKSTKVLLEIALVQRLFILIHLASKSSNHTFGLIRCSILVSGLQNNVGSDLFPRSVHDEQVHLNASSSALTLMHYVRSHLDEVGIPKKARTAAHHFELLGVDWSLFGVEDSN